MNAAEASRDGDTVKTNCGKDKSSVFFSVNNPGVMPDDVRIRVFDRFFSTKDENRGLGTYSMKLLGEGYLDGKVWFETDSDSGTTFYISIPTD